MASTRLLKQPLFVRLQTQIVRSCRRTFITSLGCNSQQLLKYRDNSGSKSPPSKESLIRCGHYDKWTDLLYEDLVALVESGDVQLIDVRELKEIQEQGAFPKCINIPLGELKTSLTMDDASFSEHYMKPKPHPHDTNIVFVGYGPIKSSAALEIAQKVGYKKARHYVGGFEEWLKKQKSS
ncbi:hypothetical protein ScPMuIL_017572 [Solemya velum]